MWRKTKLILCIICMPFFAFSQQELTLHFVRDALQSQQTNPAIIMRYNTVIGLPSVAFNYGNNAFSYNDLIGHDANSDSTFLDVDNIISQMKTENILQTQAMSDLLSVYFTLNKWHFTIANTEKFDIKFTYPKQLVDVLWNGNAKYVGQQVDIGPGLNFTSYKELSVNVARRFDKLDFGVKVKILSGLSNAVSTKKDLILYTDYANYATTLSSNYEIKTSGIEDFDKGIFTPVNNLDNPGLGIDLGMNYRLNEKWEIGFSVLDLGFINWKKNNKVYTSNGSFIYSGVDINDFIDNGSIDFDQYADSINDLYFQEKDGNNYTSYLTPKTLISTTYHLNEKSTVGGLLHLEFFDGVQPSFALYAGHSFMKYLDLGLSYSYKNRRFDNVGFNLNMGPKAFRFYVATDNLFNFLRMKGGRNVTFRYGININFSSRKEKTMIDEGKSDE